jgi:hypothetical protein
MTMHENIVDNYKPAITRARISRMPQKLIHLANQINIEQDTLARGRLLKQITEMAKT